MLGSRYEGQDCSLAKALEVLGERWTLLIIRNAFFGVQRFNDFQADLRIPKAVLAERLESLVADGVLERSPDPHHAGRSLYRLTPAGRELWPALHALLMWGDRHVHRNSRYFTHAICGGRLDHTGRCTGCGTTPGPEDVVSSPRRGRGKRGTDPLNTALRKPRRLLEPINS
jgi:DNA-binding HxlR family transcriptional regulator